MVNGHEEQDGKAAARAYTAAVETPLGTEEIACLQRSNSAPHRVIAWHGISSGNRFWYWDLLWEEATVILAGLPGHGPVCRQPTAVTRQWTPQHFFDVGEAIVRQHIDGRPATLIGHSTGGLIALGVALQAPELVARLILVNAVVWHDLRGMVRLWVEASRWPALGRGVVAATLGPGRRSYRVFRQSLRAFMHDTTSFYGNPRCESTLRAGYADYCATGDDAIVGTARVLQASDLRPAVTARPPGLPTLIIHGECDNTVPLAQAEWLAAHLPDAELYVVPGAGHLSFGEREDLINQQVRRWLDAHPVSDS